MDVVFQGLAGLLRGKPRGQALPVQGKFVLPTDRFTFYLIEVLQLFLLHTIVLQNFLQEIYDMHQ